MKYGIKTDYPKINIYASNGKYLCSTTWSRSLDEAKEVYEKTHGTIASPLKLEFDLLDFVR